MVLHRHPVHVAGAEGDVAEGDDPLRVRDVVLDEDDSAGDEFRSLVDEIDALVVGGHAHGGDPTQDQDEQGHVDDEDSCAAREGGALAEDNNERVENVGKDDGGDNLAEDVLEAPGEQHNQA